MRPSVKTSSLNADAGTVKVLHRSRQVTEPDVDELYIFLTIKLRVSSALLNIKPSQYRARI